MTDPLRKIDSQPKPKVSGQASGVVPDRNKPKTAPRQPHGVNQPSIPISPLDPSNVQNVAPRFPVYRLVDFAHYGTKLINDLIWNIGLGSDAVAERALKIAEIFDKARIDARGVLSWNAASADIGHLIESGKGFVAIIVNFPLKFINDHYGAEAGDYFIRRLGEELGSERLLRGEFRYSIAHDTNFLSGPYRRGPNFMLIASAEGYSEGAKQVIHDFLNGRPGRLFEGKLKEIEVEIMSKFAKVKEWNGVFDIPTVADIEYRPESGLSAREYLGRLKTRISDINVHSGAARYFAAEGYEKIREMVKNKITAYAGGGEAGILPKELGAKINNVLKQQESPSFDYKLRDLFILDLVRPEGPSRSFSEISSLLIDQIHELLRIQTPELKELCQLLEGFPAETQNNVLQEYARMFIEPDTGLPRVAAFEALVRNALKGSAKFSAGIFDGKYIGSWMNSYDGIGGEIPESKIFPFFDRVLQELVARETGSDEMHIKSNGPAEELNRRIANINIFLANGDIPEFSFKYALNDFIESPIVRRLGLEFFTDPNGPVKAKIIENGGQSYITGDIRNLPREDRKGRGTPYRINGEEVNLVFGVAFEGEAIDIDPSSGKTYEDIHKELSRAYKPGKRSPFGAFLDGFSAFVERADQRNPIVPSANNVPVPEIPSALLAGAYGISSSLMGMEAQSPLIAGQPSSHMAFEAELNNVSWFQRAFLVSRWMLGKTQSAYADPINALEISSAPIKPEPGFLSRLRGPIASLGQVGVMSAGFAFMHQVASDRPSLSGFLSETGIGGAILGGLALLEKHKVAGMPAGFALLNAVTATIERWPKIWNPSTSREAISWITLRAEGGALMGLAFKLPTGALGGAGSKLVAPLLAVAQIEATLSAFESEMTVGEDGQGGGLLSTLPEELNAAQSHVISATTYGWTKAPFAGIMSGFYTIGSVFTGGEKGFWSAGGHFNIWGNLRYGYHAGIEEADYVDQVFEDTGINQFGRDCVSNLNWSAGQIIGPEGLLGKAYDYFAE